MADTNPLLAAKVATATEATRERKETHKFYKGRFLVVYLGILAFIAIIVVGYTVRSLFNTELSPLSLAVAIPIALALLIISWAMPKFKKAPWLSDAIAVLGVLIFLYALFTSGFGVAFTRTIEQAERCAAYNDCDVRTDEVTVINNGRINITPRRSQTFYAVGTVTVTNHNVGHCLDVSPAGAVDTVFERDGRIAYLTPYSDEPTLVTVSALPWHDCVQG